MSDVSVSPSSFEECRKLLSAGRVSEALVGLEALQQAEPDNGEVLHHYAVALHLSGRSMEAIEVFDRALMLSPDHGNLHQNRAIALMAIGRLEDAIFSAREAVRLRPDISGGYLNLALAESRAGHHAEAWETVSRGLDAAPEHPGLLNLAVKILIEAGNLPLAESYQARAQAVAPDHVEVIHNAAMLDLANNRHEAALSAFDRVLALQPRHHAARLGRAKALHNLGRASEASPRHPQAEAAIWRALDKDPGNAEDWVRLGAIQSDAGRLRNAGESWERALFHDPTNADAWSNLGVNERHQGDLDTAGWFGRRAVESNPLHIEAWTNLGITEFEAGRDDNAVMAFQKALALRPDNAEAHFALGLALLRRGFTEGLKHYEARLASRKLGIAQGRPNLPLWKGGDPTGLSFLLIAEQGLGDTFQFVRYATWLKNHGAARVCVRCRKEVAHLIATVTAVDAIVAEGEDLTGFDVMAYMMSMPLLTGMRGDTVPAAEGYIAAEPDRVTRWADWVTDRPGFRVGIVWQGNPDPKVDGGRSIPLARFAPLAEIAGVRLISLQRGPGEEQIDALGGRFLVERPGPDFDAGPEAFADTAALIMSLDLVVTCDTAVAHLAGALGKPCWIILKPHPDWRWFAQRSDSPWYPSARLFRRVAGEVEDLPFSGVMSRVADALGKLVAGDRTQLAVAAPHEGVSIASIEPATVSAAAQQAHHQGDVATASRLFAALINSSSFRTAALYMLGTQALHAERNYRAVVFYRAAQALGLQSSEFLTNHAIALRRVGAIDGAIDNLQAVIARSPTPAAHLTLANIHRDACNFAEALANYHASLALNPDLAKAHRGMGNLMRDMHKPQEALESFERARALTPKDADLILDHAHAKLFAGDLIGGFRDYEYRWQTREMRPPTFAEPRWNGEHARGKVLLIHGEQGFGDNIQFIRFVDEVARRVGRVVLQMRGPLVELMRSIQTERPLVVIERGKPLGKFDFQIPVMSLPLALGATLDTIPPPPRFRLDPERVAVWRQRFGGANGTRIGLIWQGNPKAKADAGRSLPIAALAPLLSLPNASFVSLQKSDGVDQLEGSGLADAIIAPGEALGDFLETAHAIAALDIVVSTCTATLHLAASLGIPVFGMLKYHADWRWLNEVETSPWYPSIRLFRQPRPGDWDSVVASVRAALAERLVVP